MNLFIGIGEFFGYTKSVFVTSSCNPELLREQHLSQGIILNG